ncbi:phosphotransferase family protein [Cellulosimicrobium cellulans]|uniref:phosphotransferase family protein n=1 Tax=Cellulosimicrobium cellulans TaxID=1710 RepID=UPI001651CF7C|nr:aminoglycoside phosphotransferase family protein [Cellulosimicrobium cellulans]
MPADADLLPAVLADLAVRVPGLRADGWSPSVQGAVGHVRGLTGDDGTRYVLKVLGPRVRDRLPAEVTALGLLRDVPGVPVPVVRAHGVTAGGAAYVLMSRLGGARWADRRATLGAAATTGLTAAVGAVLRRVHTVTGLFFGDLAAAGPRRAGAGDRVTARADELLTAYRRVGGPTVVGEGVRALLAERRDALDADVVPVLCHRDLVDGNVLVDDRDPTRVSGIVDLERAAWDDPVADLALTLVHVRQHAPGDVGALLDGYGGLTADQTARLGVHEVLHLLAERVWVAVDRPSRWRESADRLDGLLRARV